MTPAAPRSRSARAARVRRDEVLGHVPPGRLEALGSHTGLRHKNSPARGGGGVIGERVPKGDFKCRPWAVGSHAIGAAALDGRPTVYPTLAFKLIIRDSG